MIQITKVTALQILNNLEMWDDVVKMRTGKDDPVLQQNIKRLRLAVEKEEN
jgi:hypothetical protein